MKHQTNPRKKIFAVFGALIFLGSSALLSTTAQTVSADTEKMPSVNPCNTERHTVFSYLDVFQSYYDQLIFTSETKTLSFEDYCSLYYKYDLQLNEYTSMVQYSIDNDVDLTAVDETVSPQSSSTDEDYILSAITYSYTPQSEYKRAPCYNSYTYAPLQVGDIVFETQTIGNYGHTAFISDLYHPGYYNGYIQTIEAVAGGVQYGFLDDTRMVDFAVYILRVTGSNSTVCNTALNFCLGQVGKNYSFSFFRKNTSYNANSWLCSELIYAAYYNAGIDIDVQTVDGVTSDGLSGILPQDIWNSDLTYSVYDFMEWIGDS